MAAGSWFIIIIIASITIISLFYQLPFLSLLQISSFPNPLIKLYFTAWISVCFLHVVIIKTWFFGLIMSFCFLGFPQQTETNTNSASFRPNSTTTLKFTFRALHLFRWLIDWLIMDLGKPEPRRRLYQVWRGSNVSPLPIILHAWLFSCILMILWVAD